MISVIIPVYNGAKYIEKTIASVYSQDCSDFEVIVVNDASTDDSLTILQRILNNKSNAYIIDNEQNQGFCKSANRGIRKSTGDLLLILGQDDLLTPNYFDSMVGFIKQTNVAMAVCENIVIDENDNINSDDCIIQKTKVSVADLTRSNVISSAGAMISRTAMEQAGGYPEFKKYPQYGEWYLWINIAKIGRIEKNTEAVVMYRKHRTNLTKTFGKKNKMLSIEMYWNRCRWLALTSDEVNIKNKLSAMSFIIYRTIRALVKTIIG